MKDSNKKVLRFFVVAGIVLVLLLAIVLILSHFLPELIPVLKRGNETEIEEYIRSGGTINGVLITVFLCFFQVISVFFPGTPIWIAVGIVFGWFKGYLVCHLSFVAANLTVFTLSRKLSGKLDEIFVSSSEEKKIKFLTDTGNPAFMVVLGCMIPIVPNGSVPYLAARTDIKLKNFFLAVMFGSFPQILAYCAIGNRLLMGDYLFAGLILGSILVSVILLYIFRNKVVGFVARFVEKLRSRKTTGDKNDVDNGGNMR
ncbi:MAG: VTT domain-containing protein [Oscillospiraceae bacterium]